MAASPERFAQLLTQGIQRIRAREGKPIRVIQDELGYELGREGGAAVEHWRKGRLPPHLADVEQLARAIVKRGILDRAWLEEFLQSAGHPLPAIVSAELFPATGSTPPVQAVATPSGPQADAGALASEPVTEATELPNAARKNVAKQEAFGASLPRPSLPPLAPHIVEAALAKFAELPLNTVPPHAPALPEGSSRLFDTNPLFVGRKAELRDLAKVLKGESNLSVRQTAAATGMGGMGKTQLAVEFAHRYGPYFAGGVYWLSFADPDAIEGQIAACGAAMPEMPDHYRELDLPTQLSLVQQAWQRPLPRLLIFDNCEDEALLVRWRPTTGGCRTLLTSRRQVWDLSLSVQPLVLYKLPSGESIELLRKFRPDLPQASAVLKAIAHELGDLPLALHLAGSYLKDRHRAVTPERYLEQLRAPSLLDHTSLHWKTLLPADYVPDIVRTFALSYDQLLTEEAIDWMAQSLLASIACFAPGEAIPWALLAATVAGGDEEQIALAADALNRLLALGLVEEVDQEAVRIHRLIALYVAHRAPEQMSSAQEAVEAALAEAAEQANQADLPGDLLPWQLHLRHITDNAIARSSEVAALLCNALGYHLNSNGDLRGAKEYFEQALRINRTLRGEEHAETASSLNNLGYVLRAMGDLRGAKEHIEAALTIRRKLLGEEHPDTATSLSNLGGLLRVMGDLKGARESIEQALLINRKLLGDEHPATATNLNNLGSVLQDLGDLRGAKDYIEQALALNRKRLGDEHPATASSLNNLGYVLRAMGDLEGARAYGEQALAIRRKLLGDEHPATATSLSNLGHVLQELGDQESAKNHIELALAIRRKLLGDEHPDTASSLNNLGSVLQELGDLRGAQHSMEQALAIMEKRLGADHPTTLAVRGRLDRVLEELQSAK
jgi:tetratricopeptide (TPR) repeat protein